MNRQIIIAGLKDDPGFAVLSAGAQRLHVYALLVCDSTGFVSDEQLASKDPELFRVAAEIVKEVNP